jgi:MFS family permease
MYHLLEREVREPPPVRGGLIGPYREFLLLPGAARLLVSALAGRLPLGMSSLAILLLVRLQTGSFAIAGLAVGAFTLSSAATTPAQGRLVDRLGGRPVLVAFAIAQAAGMTAVVVAAELKATSAILIVLAAVAGAMTPPLSACMRALWPRVARSHNVLEAAYQLDAISQEVIWTSGPLLVAAAVAAGSPVAAVLLSAGITVAGTIWFASAPATRQWRGAGRAERRPSAISNPGLRIMVGTTLLMGTAIGTVEVALPAIAVHAGSHAAAGLLLGLWSIGSMAGGLIYGSRIWRARMTVRYPTLLFLVALSTVPLIFAHTLAAAIPLSVLAGIGLAPTLACQYSLVAAVAAIKAATEAFAWTSTALVAGLAAGNAITGALVEGGGIGRSFGLASLVFSLAGLIAVASRRRVDVAISEAGWRRSRREGDVGGRAVDRLT